MPLPHTPDRRYCRGGAFEALVERDAAFIEPGCDLGDVFGFVGRVEDQPFLGATEYMASKIPGAAKAMVANAGHAANIDQP